MTILPKLYIYCLGKIVNKQRVVCDRIPGSRYRSKMVIFPIQHIHHYMEGNSTIFVFFVYSNDPKFSDR